MVHEDEHAEAEGQRRPRVVDKRVAARQEAASPHTTSREESKEAEDAPVAPAAEPPSEEEGPSGAEPLWTPEQEAQARELASQIARTPGREWVVHTAANLANIAGLKLQERQLEDARLIIDALSGLVKEVGAGLGDAEGPVRQALAQLQLAYAEATGAGPGPAAP